MRTDQKCSACGGTEHIRAGSPWHPVPICNPCFMVWYDPDEHIDKTDPAQVGALSLKLKKASPMCENGNGQAGTEIDPALRARVAELLFEWEGSGELYNEFAERIIRVILDAGENRNAAAEEGAPVKAASR